MYIWDIINVNMSKQLSIASEIKQKIFNNGRGIIYFISDFYKLENDDIVRKTLYRLEKQGILIRLAKGIYLYPKIDDEIGILKPAVEDVAEEIARRDNSKILPTGALALNMLGLSTQVPMNAVYLTQGESRQIKIGKRQITFRKAAPRYFNLKATISPLLVLALQEIREKNINEEITLQLKRVLLKSNEINLLREDLRYFPCWIRKYIISILNTIQ